MNITIRDESTITSYRYDQFDNTIYCNHDNINVTPPCCNGNNCDCRGLDNIYCPDCDNADLTIGQLDDYFINASIKEY